MKKASLCIGLFVVLILVVGICTARAQEPPPPYATLIQMDGKWLKINVTANGYDFGTWKSTTSGGDKYHQVFNNKYACVSYNPTLTSADLAIYDQAGTQIGYGNLYWESGMTDSWGAYFELYLDSAGDYIAHGWDIYVDAPATAKMKDGASKGSFNSVGLIGNVSNASSAGYFGGKLKAQIVTKIPFGGTCTGFVTDGL